ncbi:MAG: AI-2E family transporter [Anaerolineales bacterium]|nr:MAG: AI-2E family transporter [Anaerolineales bacterium]
MKPIETSEPSSPPWQPGTRLVAGVLLVLLTITILYLMRSLLAPLVLAILLAYLLHPLIARLTTQWRLSRGCAVLIVYFILVLLLVGTTTGLGVAISQRVTQLASYLRELSVELPAQIESLAGLQVPIGPWQVDLSQINLEPILSDLASAISPLLSQTGSLLASVAKATASVVTLVFLVMVLGYYLLLDLGKMEGVILELVPLPYRGDFRRLMEETGQVWNAFLRGQAILAIVMAVLVAVVLTGLGVRFPLVLGIIAGLMEFVPWFGPVVATVVTVLVALFQSGNWWGLTPLGFGLLVFIVFLIIQQLENHVLFPRIIGQSLNLHPLVVLLSVLIGGLLAGLLGLLLAAPTVATLRLWIGYFYRKAVGLDTWPGPVIGPSPRPVRSLFFQRLLTRWRTRREKMAQTDTEGDG